MNKTFLERQQARRKREKRRRAEAILIMIMTIICAAAALFFCATEANGMSQDDIYAIEQAEQPLIRTGGHETEIDPVYAQHIQLLKEQETAEPVVPKWEVSDTADMDICDDNFEMLVECAFAEAGNQCEEGIRLVVDVIGNRAGWEMSHVDDVITAKYQFSSYPDGMTKWRGHITEEFIQICADEWMKEAKADGGAGVYWFRTGRYHKFGNHFKPVGDHFFSTR